MSTFPDFHKYDGLGLAELVRAGQVSPAELVDEAIAGSRPEPAPQRRHPQDVRAGGRSRQALPDGPFAGVPFLIKDLLATSRACRRAVARAS